MRKPKVLRSRRHLCKNEKEKRKARRGEDPFMQDENPYQSPLETSFIKPGLDSQSSQVASEGRRLVNFVLDSVMVRLLASALYLVMETAEVFPRFYNAFINSSLLLFVIFLPLFYYIPQEFFWGRTIGKFITGTKIVALDGTTPSLARIIGRTLCRLIPFEAFSFLESEPVGWHDKFSGTRVVLANSTSVSNP